MQSCAFDRDYFLRFRRMELRLHCKTGLVEPTAIHIRPSISHAFSTADLISANRALYVNIVKLHVKTLGLFANSKSQ